MRASLALRHAHHNLSTAERRESVLKQGLSKANGGSMKKPIIISSEGIDEKDLRQFLADTERVTGAKITVIPQWVVMSDSPAVENALAALFTIPVLMASESVKLTKRGRRTLKSAKPVVETDSTTPAFVVHEVKSWEIHIPGVTGKTTDLPERITISEKNARLCSGSFVEGTLLRHPKAGWQRITGKHGVGQGMEPIDTQEAIQLLDAEMVEA
jgi:hypothetical protein